MKIAMPFQDEMINAHFGKSEYFIIYEVNEKEVLSKMVLPVENGHGKKAQFLRENNVNVLICGGMGMHAKEAMDSNGIKVLAGIHGNVDSVLKDYLNGRIIAVEGAIHSCCH